LNVSILLIKKFLKSSLVIHQYTYDLISAKRLAVAALVASHKMLDFETSKSGEILAMARAMEQALTGAFIPIL
jgi:hypothetical protein